MEDLSLALADAVLAFGPRGLEAARAGRLPGALPAVLAPRLIESSILERIDAESGRARCAARLWPFLYEPQQGSSGCWSR